MLTMAACNLEDTDGKILFEFKDGHVVDEVKFQQAWYKLDPLTADEIHEQVLKINLLWSEPGK